MNLRCIPVGMSCSLLLDESLMSGSLRSWMLLSEPCVLSFPPSLVWMSDAFVFSAVSDSACPKRPLPYPRRDV